MFNVTLSNVIIYLFSTGEIKSPTNTIPKSLMSGLSIVILMYLLTNISYLTVLTPQEIISSGMTM